MRRVLLALALALGIVGPAAAQNSGLQVTLPAPCFGLAGCTANIGTSTTGLTNAVNGDTLKFQQAGPSWGSNNQNEWVIINSNSGAGGSNTLSLQSTNAGDYSALTLRDNAGREIGAFASANTAGNTTGGSFWGSSCLSGTAGECTVPPATVGRQDWDAYAEDAKFTGSTSGNTLTVSGVAGTIQIGDTLALGNSAGGGYGTPTSYTITGGSGTSWTLSGTPNPTYPSQSMAALSSTTQGLTLTRFFWTNAGSRDLNFMQGTNWGAQGPCTGFQIAYAGGAALCGNVVSGVSLFVNRGSLAASRDGSNSFGQSSFWGSDASIADLVAASLSSDAPAIGWVIATKHKVKFELEGGASGPYHLDLVDIDNSNQVPFSIKTDGTKSVAIGSGGALATSGNDLPLATSGTLTTSATSGFPRFPTMTGAPTGSVTAGDIVVDTTDHKLCWNEGTTTWKCVTGS